MTKKGTQSSDVSTHISNDMLVVWYQALLNRFNTLNGAVNSIDNKTSIVLAASVAILIFGAESMSDQLRMLQITGLLGLVVSIVLSLVNINLRESPSEVNSTDDRPDYYQKDDGQFIWQLIADLEQSIESHALINRKKALIYKLLTSIFAIASVALFMSNYIEFSFSVIK